MLILKLSWWDWYKSYVTLPPKHVKSVKMNSNEGRSPRCVLWSQNLQPLRWQSCCVSIATASLEAALQILNKNKVANVAERTFVCARHLIYYPKHFSLNCFISFHNTSSVIYFKQAPISQREVTSPGTLFKWNHQHQMRSPRKNKYLTEIYDSLRLVCRCL